MKLGKVYVFIISAAIFCAASLCLRAASAGSPGNPSALELQRQAEARKDLTPEEREELAARAFMEMMKMSEDRMEAMEILIEGKITDDKGNPLSDVSASVEYERPKEFILTDASNSERKRLDMTVGPEFSFKEKGYLEVEIDFRKEGYAPRTLRYSTTAFLFDGEKDDRENLIQKDLHVVMKKLPPPAMLTGWSDSRSMIYSFSDGKRSVCDLSKIIRRDAISLKGIPPGEKPDAKCWLEFDLKRDEKGEIVPGEVTLGSADSGISAPAEFILRLHSDDPGDGFVVTDRITEMKTYRDMEYDFRLECIEAPEGAYPAKEIVFPYKKESVNGRDKKVICAYVKAGGHYGKLLMRYPSVDTRRNAQREIEMEQCRFELSLLLNVESGDRNLSSYIYRKPVIPVASVPKKEEKVYERAPEGAIDVVVPDGVTQLDPAAFRTCPEVETVVLPNSLKYIPSKAFSEYKKLKSVVLPVHASIGSYAFRGCPALESVTISKSGDDVAPLSDTASVGQSAFENCTALRSVEFPEVRVVGHFAFRGCTSLESIAIPNTVNFIGMEAFIMLPRLKTVTLPVHATVGNRAFRSCRVLESVTLTQGGEIAEPWQGDPEEDDPYESCIGNEAFTFCSALKRFEFPTCVRVIGKDAFLSCESLESITFPDELTTIDEGAFTQCCALKTLRIPDSVKTIGADAFCGSAALEKIELSAGPVEFGRGVFQDCLVLRDVKLSPFASKKVPERFFDNCRGLETVEFPSGITEIGDSVLDNCLELKSVAIPDGVESIGIRAFAGCPKLERVSLPASLKTIGNWAFGGCGLKEVTIPEGVTEIAPEAFRGSPCEGAVRKVLESRRQKNP
jgi:hypothetical protein